MSTIPYERVRRLAAHEGHGLVSTVYLDVDGRHRPVLEDVKAAFERLAGDLLARSRQRLGHDELRAVEADIDAMRGWLADHPDRSATRGVAMYSDSGAGWFEGFTLPEAVRDDAGVSAKPRIGQLVAVLADHRPYTVGLVDRRRLRVFRYEWGKVRESVGIEDLEERAADNDVELGSWEHRREEAARVHFRRAARHLERILAEDKDQPLLLGGTDEAVAGVEANLSAAVRARVAGRVPVPVAATDQELAAAAGEVIARVEQQRDNESAERLWQLAAGNHRGVLGLEATLTALEGRQVERLLLSEGFSATGASCPSCGHLGIDLRQCPRCGATNVEIDDVVETAVEEAVAQHASVSFFRNGELDALGRIGAVTRH